jgi:hypothetical protein
MATKKIIVEYSDGILKIFDSGAGLSIADIQAVYDFDNYVTKNRHIINISCGKLGNGLKTVSCHDYSLTCQFNEVEFCQNFSWTADKAHVYKSREKK